jgi:septum formation protein
MKIVLASTSVYRHELLARLHLPFSVAAPNIDETPQPHETPTQTALRLAEAKARAVAAGHPTALIIGSDQVAHINQQQFGKPGNRMRAIEQLRFMSGKTVCFDTALALYNSAQNRTHSRCVTTEVRFRNLTLAEIERYVDLEPAFDCAGSAKIEGLGITLLSALSGDDPTALIGLPLIALADMLRAEGIELP